MTDATAPCPLIAHRAAQARDLFPRIQADFWARKQREHQEGEKWIADHVFAVDAAAAVI